MNKLTVKALRTCFVMLHLMLGASVFAEASNPSIALRIASPKEFDPQRISDFCKTQTPACNPATTKAYVRRKGKDGFVYMMDASKPLLIRSNLNEPKQPPMTWDFSKHVMTFELPQDDKQQRAEIYPALYLVDAHSLAIALTQKEMFGYSGGGGMDVSADFLLLTSSRESANTWRFKPLYRGVPFASSSTSRACFTEKDHADLRHHRRRSCDEENNAYLTIEFRPTNEDHGPWRFTWHLTHLSAEKANLDKKIHLPFDVIESESLEAKENRLGNYFVNRGGLQMLENN
jgi:hypothetical protein